MKYAISTDWVEIYGSLDLAASSWHTLEHGYLGEYEFKRKPYGTRVYQFIFEVSRAGTEFMTICCMPLSKRSCGGIMNDDMCHVKIANYWLYRDDWYSIFTHALHLFVINPVKLSRLDICCDWQCGMCGMWARDLLSGLMKNRYYKIHQASWRANGDDSQVQKWHSLAFGSKSSPVFTRFYNKTLELQVTGKDYIREHWKLAGLNLERDVYRVEFAMHDTGKQVLDDETGEIFDISLEDISDRQHVADLFFHYAQHYFDIRKAGTAAKRTDCTPVRLFPTVSDHFRPVQRPRYLTSTRTDRIVIRQMIVSMFTMPTTESRRFMYNAINDYIKVKRSAVLCRGAMTLLLDALHSDQIDPNSLVDEMFEMSREHFKRYDKKGVWVYEIVNDARVSNAGVYD